MSSGQQKVVAIKPEQALAGIVGIVVLFLVFKLLFSLEASYNEAIASGAPHQWHHKAYHLSSLNTHFPGLIGEFRTHTIQGRAAWMAGYVPAILPIVFLAVFLTYAVTSSIFAKPEVSILEDPEFDVRHLGVDTPSLCHLPPLLHVCPDRNKKALVEALAMGEIDPYAPPSSKSDISDSPSTFNLK